METATRAALLAHLTALITQGNAHATFEQACADVPLAVLNQRVPAAPYSIWQLAEHVRIAQHDILEFCRNPAYKSPEWPAGYWPAPAATATEAQWKATRAHIRRDQAAFLAWLHDGATDLLAPLPHGSGQTPLREALLIADHAAYHTGEIILLRRLLGNWE